MEGVANEEDIDNVMKLGMAHPMGPLTLADFIGLDVCLSILEVLYTGFGDPKYRPCPLLKKMVAAGYMGKKSGRGFYTYAMTEGIIKRSDEREFALKMFYAREYNSDPWMQQIERLSSKEKRMATKYVKKLSDIYTKHIDEFDLMIKKRLKNWELTRIAVIDKIILRLALSEILYLEDIPPQVSINEAIELAKKYSTEKSGKFINGILDAIYHQHKSQITS
jgi:transcription antitermination factor NusB